MRPARFVHVGLTHQLPSPNLSQQIALTDAVVASESHDWIRYAWNCYILWTQSDCETIVRKIMRVPGQEGINILACEVIFDGSFGSFPEWVWEWIGRDRGRGPLLFTDKPLLLR